MARVTRVKKVDEEKNDQELSQQTNKRTQKAERKLGKRSPSFSVLPLRKNKAAKIGAAAASVLAVSIALFGNMNQGQIEESNEFSFGRNLLSVPEEN